MIKQAPEYNFSIPRNVFLTVVKYYRLICLFTCYVQIHIKSYLAFKQIRDSLATCMHLLLFLIHCNVIIFPVTPEKNKNYFPINVHILFVNLK